VLTSHVKFENIILLRHYFLFNLGISEVPIILVVQNGFVFLVKLPLLVFEMEPLLGELSFISSQQVYSVLDASLQLLDVQFKIGA